MNSVNRFLIVASAACCLVSPSFVFAQSKEETKDFLRKLSREPAFNFTYVLPGTAPVSKFEVVHKIQFETKIDFVNDVIIVEWKEIRFGKSKVIETAYYEQRASLKDLDPLTVKLGAGPVIGWYMVTFDATGGKNVISKKVLPSGESVSPYDRVYMNVRDEANARQCAKALTRLITLSGGKSSGSRVDPPAPDPITTKKPPSKKTGGDKKTTTTVKVFGRIPGVTSEKRLDYKLTDTANPLTPSRDVRTDRNGNFTLVIDKSWGIVFILVDGKRYCDSSGYIPTGSAVGGLSGFKYFTRDTDLGTLKRLP